MKKNSSMLIGIIVVIIVIVGAFAIFHKPSKNSSSTNAYGSSQPATTQPSTKKPASSGAIQSCGGDFWPGRQSVVGRRHLIAPTPRSC